jgi:hypothetical protein
LFIVRKAVSVRTLSRALAVSLILWLGAVTAQAGDIYTPSNRQLASPSLSICNATFSNIVVSIGAVTGGPTGTAANGTADTFNPAYNRLTVPAVELNGKSYYNIVASVSGLVSVAGVTGADVYDGSTLTIAAVQVGGTVYAGTVIKVAKIVSIAGGMPNGIRDLYNLETGQLYVPAVQDQVSGKVYTNITVTVAGIQSIGATLTGASAAGCAPPSGARLTAAQINAASASVQSYFSNLPHTSLASDLNTAAGYMVASGLFLAARPSADGISATLPDGSGFIEYADRLEDFGTTAAVTAVAAAHARAANARPAASLGPVNAHEIVYLVNMSDLQAFSPQVQEELTAAWSEAGFGTPNFGIATVDVTLENILALGAGYSIDLLDIATHGTVYFVPPYQAAAQYTLLSDTKVNDANLVTYAADLVQGRLFYGWHLFYGGGKTYDTEYAFTPAFLTAHLTFNAGAIVDNQSCSGQDPSIAAAVQQQFSAAGAGYYLGWSQPVLGQDADQTDVFLFDRLLGEPDPNLSTYVAMRSPEQRPFPLTEVLAAMGKEVRNPVTNSSTPQNTYLQSDAGSTFIVSPLAAAATSSLTEYGRPSISTMTVQESSTGATLTVNGTFPATAGTAKIGAAKSFTPLTVLTWTPSQIVVSLPSSGAGAWGFVSVTSADGVTSNSVELSSWKGQLLTTETDTLVNMDGIDGSGTGTVTTTATVHFRADVEPVVLSIDTDPVPQNLIISALMPDSSAAVTGYGGSFISSDGKNAATFTMVSPEPALTPVSSPPFAADSFGLLPYPGQPAPCNSGAPGTGAHGNVFCPVFGLKQSNVGTCTATQGTVLCASPSTNLLDEFAVPTLPGDGLLELTMDPTTFTITVSAIPASLTYSNQRFQGTGGTVNATITGTIGDPLAVP